MLRMRRISIALCAAGLALSLLTYAVAAPAAPAVSRRDPSMLLEGKAAVQRALRSLQGAQAENGSWRDQPAITALVVTAMVGSGQEEFGPKSPVVTKALACIRKYAQPDGGIYDRLYPSYSTSVCAMALVEAGLPEDKPLIAKARNFLLDLQGDESEDLPPKDPNYGGWGYERPAEGQPARRADLSNTAFALEAIHDIEQLAEEDRAAAGAGQGEKTRTELAYDRAIQFLQRCQNLKASNDQPWTADDGGFVYSPAESKAGESDEGGLRSYASMTYAGLKSMIYARLAKNDPRVVAAWEWARKHWSVTENPGMEDQGLYYYYLTMARALNAYGTESIVDAAGKSHDWRAELVGQLLKVQQADGSWLNANGRWMESIPELVTAYSVLAIEHATAGW